MYEVYLGVGPMNPQPKQKNFRSQKLRDLAREAPHCMYCGRTNMDDVVA